MIHPVLLIPLVWLPAANGIEVEFRVLFVVSVNCGLQGYILVCDCSGRLGEKCAMEVLSVSELDKTLRFRQKA